MNDWRYRLGVGVGWLLAGVLFLPSVVLFVRALAAAPAWVRYLVAAWTCF